MKTFFFAALVLFTCAAEAKAQAFGFGPRGISFSFGGSRITGGVPVMTNSGPAFFNPGPGNWQPPVYSGGWQGGWSGRASGGIPVMTNSGPAYYVPGPGTSPPIYNGGGGWIGAGNRAHRRHHRH